MLNAYGYIVVGGSSTDLAIANCLSENASTTVPVIEAGDIGKGEDVFHVSGDAGITLGASYDWQIPTVPQDFLLNRNITIPSGKAVGGGSAVNSMLFDRVPPAGYDG